MNARSQFQRVQPFSLPSLLAVLVLLGGPLAAAAEIDIGPVSAVEESDRIDVRFTLSFNRNAQRLGSSGTFDTVEYAGIGTLSKSGEPALPARTLRIALPAGMAATTLSVGAVNAHPVPGEFVIEPARRPYPLNGTVFGATITQPDRSIYESAARFPEQNAVLLSQCDLAGQTMAAIRVCPVQYAPATRSLTFVSSMELTITGSQGTACGDLLPSNLSARGRDHYARLLSGMVANPADVIMRTGRPANPGPGRGVGPGSYDYVIITPDDWADDFEPLADWRTAKGIPATIVTTEWIYNSGGYSGNNLDKIRAFVEDAHTTWGAFSFLLGGDSGTIPYHVRTITVPGYWTDDIANDTYLADFDDDWVLEVNMARAPVRSTAHIADFVDKILDYEKTPPLTGWATTGAYFGFDNASPGDGYGERSKDLIASAQFPASWTLNTEYDSETGLHKADVIGYLNQGHHLVNHHDHCNQDIMGVGYISHGELLYNSDVGALSNGDRQSIVFAVGCYPAYFPNITSIGEKFVRHTSGGAVAFMGNTCIGWGGSPTGPNAYTTLQDEYFYRNLFADGFERLGANFTDFKNDVYDSNDPYNLYQYTFTEMHLLGDPELEVWTADPMDLTAQHDSSLDEGTPVSFTVTVSDSGSGAPMEGATVCIWKEGEIYEVGATDSTGVATFPITPSGPGTMRVTVSEHDYIPYEGEVTINSTAPVPDIKVDGQDGPITVFSSQTVDLTISLLAAGQQGVPHDWWVGGVLNGSTLYCWTYPGQWSLCTVPLRAYNGPLIDITDYLITRGKIPAGSWNFIFAVDALNNSFEGTYIDTIAVTSL